MRRPTARLSELGFTFVLGLMIPFYVITLWPEPALDVSPAWCRPMPSESFKPQSGDRLGGLPASYERYNR